MNLVVGATGFLGGAICRLLVERGKPVRALIRTTSHQARLEQLERLGTEIVRGDLKDRASLDAACQGVTTVISTATTTGTRQAGDSIESVDHEGQLRLVDAARAAGVQHFIYISYSRNITTDCPLTTAKRAVEKHLEQSGMTYTVLRPSYFMEVWLGSVLGFDFAHRKAQIFGKGEKAISWIALEDVAKFAVESVDNPAARNATIELGGPEAVSPNAVVSRSEQLGGQPFEVQYVPDEALHAQYAGAADSLQRSFAALALDYVHGDVIDMRQTLNTFPIQLTSVEDYIRRMLA